MVLVMLLFGLGAFAELGQRPLTGPDALVGAICVLGAFVTWVVLW